MTAKMTVKGLKSVDFALKEFPKRFAKKGINRVFRVVQKDVTVRDYKRIAPKKSGKLAKKAKVRASKRSRRSFGIAVIVEHAYASFVLLGTKWIRGAKSLRIAFFGNKSIIRARVEGGLRVELPKIADEVRRHAKSKG